MHELSIAESILEAVRKELVSHPGARPTRVGLRIGELAAVDVDSLSFCFEAVLKDTEWEGLQLDARVCPQRRMCNACGNEFAVVDYNTMLSGVCRQLTPRRAAGTNWISIIWR